MDGLNREHIGLAFLIGSALCVLLVHAFKPQNATQTEQSNSSIFKIATMIWLFVFVYSMIPLMDSLKNYSLSLPYFVSIGVLSLIITYQILGTKKLTQINVLTIIAEIVILAFYLSAALIFLFPAPIGNDAVWNTGYISSIVDTGNLQSYAYVDQYANFPIYHLSFAALMIMSHINIQAAQLILALVQILAVLFIFIICKKIFNEKIALLSALLITLSSQMIIPRYSFYPSNYAIVYYMLLLFVLLCLGVKKSNIWPVVLIVLVAINFMHPIVSVIATFTVILFYILAKIFKFENIMSLRYVILSIFITLVQLIRPIPKSAVSSSSNMLAILTVYIMNTLSGSISVAQATMSQFHSWSDVVLYELGFTILILFGVCGALMILKLSQNNYKFNVENHKDKRIVLSAITLIMLPIPYVLAVVAPQTLPDRWFVFVTVFIGIFAAVAIYLLSQQLKKMSFVAMLAIPVIVFFLITAPISNPNNQIYAKDMTTRPSLTLSELDASTLFKNVINLNSICANSLYAVRIDYALNYEDHFIDPRDSYNGPILLIRNYDMDNGFTIPLFGKDGNLVNIIMPTSSFTQNLDNSDKFYENGEVRAYLT